MNFKGLPPMTGSLDSLRTLDNIEKDLCSALQSAGQAIQELSKDKPSMKQVETHTNSFLKTLQSVESNISQQIIHLNQVSTGQAHEGSIYASQKVLNMAWHRFEHVKSKLNELEKMQSADIITSKEPQPQPQPGQQQQIALQQGPQISQLIHQMPMQQGPLGPQPIQQMPMQQGPPISQSIQQMPMLQPQQSMQYPPSHGSQLQQQLQQPQMPQQQMSQQGDMSVQPQQQYQMPPQ